MATKAKRAKRKPVNLNRIPVWNPHQASQWSGIKYRLFLRLLHAGMVPHIVCATARPAASQKRIYLIPREPFQKWLNSIGPKGVAAATGETATITTNTGETAA
jgi:hypothetical protein